MLPAPLQLMQELQRAAHCNPGGCLALVLCFVCSLLVLPGDYGKWSIYLITLSPPPPPATDIYLRKSSFPTKTFASNHFGPPGAF